MLKSDVITYTQEVSGNSTGTITSIYPTTIVGINFLQEKDLSTTEIYCGNNKIYCNWAKDTPYIEMNYKCDELLWWNKVGNDKAHIIINYLPYDYEGDTATNTENIINGISTGQLALTSIILLYFLAKMIKGIYELFFGIKIKKL